ncbi:MAG: hypothetical protein J7J61_05535 [Candidatus Hydrothermae bacterium]|nr:hypothetical protein [Candidatus Hydrothermae bacterium]
MSYFDEFLQLIAQMRAKFRYDMNVANFYGIADFRRNEFVIYGKKAIREFIRSHANELDRNKRMLVSQLLNKAVMTLYNYPELKSYFESRLEELIS